jgi:hypothetical protein
MSVWFFPGLHQPSDAHRFKCCCISIHRLGKRIKPLGCPFVLVDSGAFTTIQKHRGYPRSVFQYAHRLWELHTNGTIEIAAAVSLDYMCEPKVVAHLLGIPEKDLTPEMHRAQVLTNQELSIKRYDELMEALDWLFDGEIPFPVLPVLQG